MQTGTYIQQRPSRSFYEPDELTIPYFMESSEPPGTTDGDPDEDQEEDTPPP
jgi:hypothetical protein